MNDRLKIQFSNFAKYFINDNKIKFDLIPTDLQ